ncbi:MAG: CaiB/BaiF CoA-transferase family protein [Alphaproteobacteria bacterium]|nr:CaiB/BaiF CoA-transferase family protein [Alphaproteobacteria bacterium]
MGPLKGLKVIEIAGIGPGPFCAMMLADMGADVVRIDRKSQAGRPGTTVGADPRKDVLNRGRRSLALDLKKPESVETVLKLCESADVILEGFRPGVMERLGLGPDEVMGRNASIVYGRMTGWGQDGPYSKVAGHDINYIALSGALHAIGRKGDKPVPPMNLVGDFGGGGMVLAFGVVCAVLEAQKSGKGQIVDAAMVDGAALLMTPMYGLAAMGRWNGDERGVNLLDTGAHFYEVYETSDGKYISVGSIEPQFYALLVEKAGLDKEEFSEQMNPAKWPGYKDKLVELFKTKTRDEWCEIMEYTDICFAPVLSMNEAYKHPHNAERNTFIEVAGVRQPGPAPRFSRTAAEVARPSPKPGEHNDEVLKEWGLSDDDISALKEKEAI